MFYRLSHMAMRDFSNQLFDLMARDLRAGAGIPRRGA
jgi:hypothetical protein